MPASTEVGMIHGFVLGFANGSSCLAYCAPILLPYFLGEGRTVRRSGLMLAQFLAGRLAGYLLFAAAAWRLGAWLRGAGPGGVLLGATYAALAVLLMAYGLAAPRPMCAADIRDGWVSRMAGQFPRTMPALIGLLTGLTLCPPFLAALADSSSQATLAGSLVFFLAFFAATALFFVPLPFAGLLRRFEAVRTVGRLACGIMGLYYLYRGLVMFYAGWVS
jgi:hypothetical protein